MKEREMEREKRRVRERENRGRKITVPFLFRIFSFLDVVSLCRCAQVSKVSQQSSTTCCIRHLPHTFIMHSFFY